MRPWESVPGPKVGRWAAAALVGRVVMRRGRFPVPSGGGDSVPDSPARDKPAGIARTYTAWLNGLGKTR